MELLELEKKPLMHVNTSQWEYFLQYKNEQAHIWSGEADSGSS